MKNSQTLNFRRRPKIDFKSILGFFLLSNGVVVVVVVLVLMGENALANPFNCSSAFVISGGSNPFANHDRYYKAIDMAHKVFAGCPISNFVTTGKAEDPVTTIFESVRLQLAPKKFLKIKKLKVDGDGMPLLQAKVPTGGFQGAASYEDIKKAASLVQPPTFALPEPVAIYVTDHGVYNDKKQKGEIVLWDEKKMDSNQLNNILTTIPGKRKVILLFDECYGGDMLKSLWSDKGILRPHACGISAASPGQLAYSTGGLMKNLHEILVEKNRPQSLANKKKFTYRDLYNIALHDKDIKSTPMLSSDLFANSWFANKDSFIDETSKDESESSSAIKTKVCQVSSKKSPLSPVLIYKINFYLNELQAEQLPRVSTPTSTENVTASATASATNEWKSMTELKEQYLKEKAISEEKFNLFQNYVLRNYNPHLRKQAETYLKDFSLYDKLRTRLNSGETLSSSEQESLSKIQNDVNYLKATLKDEAKIAKRHPTAPFVLKFTEKTINVVKKHNALKEERNKASNQMFQTKHKITKITTIMALNQMLKEGNAKALEDYLSLVECENTVISTLD